jgi:hypothetical protein
MTRDDLFEVISEQTQACGPAREALIGGWVGGLFK